MLSASGSAPCWGTVPAGDSMALAWVGVLLPGLPSERQWLWAPGCWAPLSLGSATSCVSLLQPFQPFNDQVPH